MSNKRIRRGIATGAIVGIGSVLLVTPAEAQITLPNRASFKLDAVTWKGPPKSYPAAKIRKAYCSIATTCPVRVWEKFEHSDSSNREHIDRSNPSPITVVAAGRVRGPATAKQKMFQAVVETNAGFIDKDTPPLKWSRATLQGKTVWRLGLGTVRDGATIWRVRALVAVQGKSLATVFIIQKTSYVAGPKPMIRAVSRFLTNKGPALPLVQGPVRGLVPPYI